MRLFVFIAERDHEGFVQSVILASRLDVMCQHLSFAAKFLLACGY